MIVTTDNKNYQDIAGAIRKIGETDETYTPAEMANAILLASVNAHDLDDIDLSNKEEAYFLYDSKLDTDGIPRFVSLYAATNDGSQYSVSRGHVENNNFVADSTELINSRAPFFEWIVSGDVRYILYRVAPQEGSHIITIGQSDSPKDSSGNYYAYFSQPQIKRKSRLPYLSRFFNWGNSYVTREETLDVSQVTSLPGTWQNCASLVNLDLSGWDVSQVTSLSNTWYNCASLVNLDPAIIRADFSLSKSTYLTIDSLVAQLEALPTVTSPTTITIGSKNQSKLTEEQIKIATDKGWTVA